MPTASVRTLRNDYARLIARAEAGEIITILRHGKPVAKLSPAGAPLAKVQWAGSAALKRKRPSVRRPDFSAVLADNKGQY